MARPLDEGPPLVPHPKLSRSTASGKKQIGVSASVLLIAAALARVPSYNCTPRSDPAGSQNALAKLCPATNWLRIVDPDEQVAHANVRSTLAGTEHRPVICSDRFVGWLVALG